MIPPNFLEVTTEKLLPVFISLSVTMKRRKEEMVYLLFNGRACPSLLHITGEYFTLRLSLFKNFVFSSHESLQGKFFCK